MERLATTPGQTLLAKDLIVCASLLARAALLVNAALGRITSPVVVRSLPC